MPELAPAKQHGFQDFGSWDDREAGALSARMMEGKKTEPVFKTGSV
jgi:hypothetical protein